MNLTDLVPALITLGRLEGSAHGFREAAKNLREIADRLDQTANSAEEQAATARKGTEALMAGSRSWSQKATHPRIVRAIAAARAAWKGGA